MKRSIPFADGRSAQRGVRIPAHAVAVHHPEKRAGRIPAASLAEHEAALIATARALFYAAGFERTSIELIARTAHVSPKTIYGRFGSKEGLFAACMRERTDEVLAALRGPMASGDDMRALLVDFATRLLRTTSSAEALLLQRLVIAESARFPELGAAFFEAGPQRGMTTLAALFARATAAGLLDVPDATAAAEMFAGALLGVPLRAALIGRERVARAGGVKRANAVVDLFLAAYRAGQPGGAPDVRIRKRRGGGDAKKTADDQDR